MFVMCLCQVLFVFSILHTKEKVKKETSTLSSFRGQIKPRLNRMQKVSYSNRLRENSVMLI